MELFLVLTWVTIAILFNTMPFFAQKEIYKFHRNILYARYGAFIVSSILMVSAIAMPITNESVGGQIFAHHTILATFLIVIVILIISTVNYILKGEGLYSEGLLMNGYLFEYSNIISYYITDSEKDSRKIIFITTKSILGLDIIRTAYLSTEIAERLDKELKGLGILRCEY